MPVFKLSHWGLTQKQLPAVHSISLRVLTASSSCLPFFLSRYWYWKTAAPVARAMPQLNMITMFGRVKLITSWRFKNICRLKNYFNLLGLSKYKESFYDDNVLSHRQLKVFKGSISGLGHDNKYINTRLQGLLVYLLVSEGTEGDTLFTEDRRKAIYTVN